MKILGKAVSNKFQLFYKEIAAQIGKPLEFERGPFQAMGDYRLDNGVVKIRLDLDMARPYFEHNAAHELVHALQDSQLWPTTARKGHLAEGSSEARVGSELAALVRDLHADQTLETLGFDNQYANDVRYRNSKKALANEAVPRADTPASHIWAIRYCYLALTQTLGKWQKLRQLYLQRAPSIAQRGEVLIAVMKENGWSTPEQALETMIAIRRSLGLTGEHIMILDNKTGTIH